MTKAMKTKDKLLEVARTAFWERGYSNVSLRDISGAAGVDVALISRYFGSKLGLFEATLDCAFEWPELFDPEGESPVEMLVRKFSAPQTETIGASVNRMVLVNGSDPEVGAMVRERVASELAVPLAKRMGGAGHETNVALFLSVFLGTTAARQTLKLPGLADQSSEEFADQLRHMAAAALSWTPKP